MIPTSVRCWHKDSKKAVETDEDGLDRDVHVVQVMSLLVVECRS